MPRPGLAPKRPPVPPPLPPPAKPDDPPPEPTSPREATKTPLPFGDDDTDDDEIAVLPEQPSGLQPVEDYFAQQKLEPQMTPDELFASGTAKSPEKALRRIVEDFFNYKTRGVSIQFGKYMNAIFLS